MRRAGQPAGLHQSECGRHRLRAWPGLGLGLGFGPIPSHRGSLPAPAPAGALVALAPPGILALAQLQWRPRPRRHLRLRGRTGRRQAAGASAGSLSTGRSQRLIFFGGKGGVGKTSCSAAYALALAEQGTRTLLLSTDPAHSLADALGEVLSGEAREVAENLWAMEVDPTEALAELRSSLQSLDIKSFLDGMGLPGGTAAALGLEELSELLDSPPPGVDELVAIARVADASEGFDAIVFDTAPTGHTLRMLEVPKFLGDFIDRALSIRRNIAKILGPLGLLGISGKLDTTLDKAEESIRAIRARISWLAKALKSSPGSTAGTTAEFIAVTRPTMLDCAEVERLLAELHGQGVSCRRMIINQVIAAESGETYWNSRVRAQAGVLAELRLVCASRSIPLVEVAERPESLVGVPALGYLASVAYDGQTDAGASQSSEVTLFGGKGGVGKTSMSSAYAVRLASTGSRVLAVSTDPAHSLGDALGVQLSNKPTQVDTLGSAGELWAMEVDTAEAMGRFQATVREALQVRQQSGGVVGQVLQQLPMEDFVNLFDTLPPGSDEVVALVELLEEVEAERFDHVVIDMAPTGHALRLLSFPDFLERLADRVARLRDRFGWLSTGSDAEGGGSTADQLRSFQFRMIKLQDLFTDASRTSFTAVAIPTKLALAETKRLLTDLDEQDIRVGMVIANRVLLDSRSASDGVERLLQTQQASLSRLDALGEREGVDVTKFPLLDCELDGQYGLRYLGSNLDLAPA